MPFFMTRLNLMHTSALHLNPEQQAAVEHIKGSMVVIAGAGSGKTRVITSRIIKLIKDEQAHPATIIALTFTNKAAKEMRERIAAALEDKSQVPFIGTFHSYCLYYLKRHAQYLPFSPFSIFDEDDKRALISRLLKNSPLYKKYTPQALAHQISHAKNQLIDPTIVLTSFIDNYELKALVDAYEKEKRQSHCFDFDDLMLQTLMLFKKNNELRQAHQHHVRHILVDEYQDTNVVQHELLKCMSLENGELAVDSMCVVGDEDQSIYSWRGATVDNIMHFTKDFKNTKTFKIEQNYRSKQPILTVANHVIENNSNRNEKKLWSTRKGSDCVRVLRCLSGYQEAEIIARYCKFLHGHKKLASTAILYRTHLQSRLIEEALIKLSVPYHMIGGVRFYERKEIKDILAHLKLVTNSFDTVSFARVVNVPARGLGDKFLEEFLDQWSLNPQLSFIELAEKLISEKMLAPSRTESLQNFCNVFKGVQATSNAAQVISDLLAKIEYLPYLRKTYEKQEADERFANLKELINAAHFFAQQGKETIEAFLDEVSLLQDQGSLQEEQPDGAIMMTLHAAKGLEFDNVIIPGLEETLLPSSRSTNDPNALEEERRLMYVGITRARERLLISCARFRQTYGSMEEQLPSRFLEEIPQHSSSWQEAFNWQIYDVNAYFSHWFGVAHASPEVFTFSTSRKAETVTPKAAPASTTYVPAKESTKTKISSGFKKHQTVKHATFGIGIIKEIEEKPNKTVITAHFKSGTKKIDASFLESV